MPDARTAERPSPGTERFLPDDAPHGGRRRQARSATALPVAVLLGAAAAVFVGGTAVPGPLGPGVGILAVALVAVLLLFALDRPVFAVGLLLVTAFLQQSLRHPALPMEPAFMALGLVLVAGAIAVTRRVSRAPSFGAIECAMGLYFLWNVASAIAPHPYEAGGAQAIGEAYSVYHFILTGTLMPFVLYVVGRFVFDRAATVRALLWVVIALWAYSIWVSIAQFAAPGLVWPRYILDYPPSHSWSDRAVGVFSQPVANGALLIVGFLLAIHLIHQADTRRPQRLLLGGLALLSLYAIYLTYTRVVWLGFAVAVLAAAIFLRRTRHVYLATLLAMGVGVLVNLATFLSADRAEGGVTSSYEIHDRLNMIATAFWAIGEKPVLGWGVGTFAQVNTYHHQQWSPSIDWIRGYGIVSHHTEIGIFAELGIIGLLLWLAVVALLVRGLLRAVRTLPADHTLVNREFAVVVAILYAVWVLIGFTADIRFFGFGSMVILLLIGVVVGESERRTAARRFRPARPPRRLDGPRDDIGDEDLVYVPQS